LDKKTKIFIAGHRGMVGSAIWRRLSAEGYTNLIGKSSSELDLRNQRLVAEFMAREKPDVVIDAAARVGGILANSMYPYNFLMENLLIQNNLINTAVEKNVGKFIFLGSSCIYPKLAPQPLKEEYLLTGPLEPTNEWYAIAKIAGVKSIEAIRQQFGLDYTSLMPTNLYGPYDNFDLHTSHVLPAMIRKFHEGKLKGEQSINLWGSGTPMREFLHVDDLASAVSFSLNNELNAPLFNVGTGKDLTIKALAELIQQIVGFDGEINWDTTKPDGTPRKLLDVSKLQEAGWTANIQLWEGIQMTYHWYKSNQHTARTVTYS
jgi:GDP-L-fucose synthase